MVQLLAALGHHTGGVELQIVGADGHADGLLAHRLLQRCLVVLWHILVAVNGHDVPVAAAARLSLQEMQDCVHLWQQSSYLLTEKQQSFQLNEKCCELLQQYMSRACQELHLFSRLELQMVPTLQ